MITDKEICDQLKKMCPVIDEVYLHDYSGFVNGERRIKKNGKYKVTIEFEAKDVLLNPNCLPFKKEDYNFRPYFLFIKWKKEKPLKKDCKKQLKK